MFLIGRNIIGYHFIDFKQPPCNADNDCMNNEKCCLFYNDNVGVCDKADNCQAIQQLSFEAYSNTKTEKKPFFNAFSAMSANLNGKQRTNFLYSTLVGLSLILFAMFGFLVNVLRNVYEYQITKKRKTKT